MSQTVLKGPTIITAERRAIRFDPSARVFKRFKAVSRIPRETLIDEKQNRQGGINLLLLRRGLKAIKKAESLFARQGLPNLDIKIRQALVLDNIAADFADHGVNSTKRKAAMEAVIEGAGIHTTQLTQKETESKVWEHYFGSFILSFFGKNGELGKTVVDTLVKLNDYLEIPLVLHKERVLHWRRLQRIEETIKKGYIDPAINLAAKVQQIMTRFSCSGNQKSPQAYRRLALDVVVAVSIYTDLVTESSRKEFKNPGEWDRFWSYAYGDGMQKIFPLLGHDERLFDEIAALHRSEKESEAAPLRA